MPPDDSGLDPKKQSADSALERLYASEEAILATVATRKEMRKAGGLVKLASGSIEKRRVAFDEPWNVQDEDQDEDEDEEGSGEEVVSEESEGDHSEESEDENGSGAEEVTSDMDEEQNDDESESDASPPIPKKAKRKRGAETSTLPPSKKVEFRRDPKEPERRPVSLKGQINPKEGEKTRVLKSALKPSSLPKPLAKTKILSSKSSKQKGKVANQSSKGAVSVETTKGEEAYDFRTFF